MEALRRSVERAATSRPESQVLRGEGLVAHLQPLVAMADGSVIAHESLIRGPEGSALRSPEALLRLARETACSAAFEEVCLRAGIRDWARCGARGRLFVNLSANALVQMLVRVSADALMRELSANGLAPSALVIEITEHEHVGDLPRLLAAASELRAHGIQFALDDFGDGRSSLRLWAELRPEFVKIDKYFVRNLNTESVKVQTVRGLMGFAEVFGTKLVAEGIETEEELRVVRDLGIHYGQGYFLGRPQATLTNEISLDAERVLKSLLIAVLPESPRAAGKHFTIEQLLERVPPLPPDTPVDELARMFARQDALRAVALVQDDRPVGLVHRQAFIDQYAKPYFKEIYGRKPGLLFANTNPLLLDRHTGIDGATEVLTSADQRYLVEGFIVTEGGRYIGLGTGQHLVRVVTEARIEAARHANPLTFLPGNIPIREHISRLLTSGGEFVACYGDLNDFKPFNDVYGYWRGDEMIRLLARTFVAHCDPQRDFVGHVGGDDFVVLFQSTDWMERCELAVTVFNERARDLFDSEAVERGGIEAEDRHGVKRFFKCTTLSIGAVRVRPGRFKHAEEVASAAASAKSRAKHTAMALAVELP